jgi:TetR/AcrR family transcriptional regulator, lmrAB and yxaGH operons repressor
VLRITRGGDRPLEAGDACVVDQDVESPVRREQIGDDLGPLGFVAHVVVYVRRTAPDRSGRSCSLRVPQIAENDPRALGDERPRDREADAAGCAGDQRDLSVESSCHVTPVPRRADVAHPAHRRYGTPVRAPLHSRDEVLDRLLERFRVDGYDGASLAVLSETTGLGRSSLYHHFPGGKEDMAKQVLAHLDDILTRDILAPLADDRPPQKRLDAMIRAVAAFYEDGRKASLLERLTASVDRGRFQRPLGKVFGAWIDALTQVARDAGLAPAKARDRAEAAVVQIEGALIVAAGTHDPAVFTRALKRIRATLLED